MKLVYCFVYYIYSPLYISHFLRIISYQHLKHNADKCTCAWEFKKPFIFCFITLRCIQTKINEQMVYMYIFTAHCENLYVCVMTHASAGLICSLKALFNAALLNRIWPWLLITTNKLNIHDTLGLEKKSR